MMLRSRHAMLLLFALPLGARADGGYYEINKDCAAVGCFAGDSAGFPITITQGGRYRLTSSLAMGAAFPASVGILVSAAAGPAVDLDLGGFSIDGLARCSGNPVTSCLVYANGGTIGIEVSSQAVVRVHDGTVLGMQSPGLAFDDFAGGSTVDNVTVTECNANGAYLGGVVIGGSAAIALRDVRVVRNIYGGVDSSARATFVGATITGNGGSGLHVSQPSVTVKDSTFSDNAGLGIASAWSMALGGSSFFDNNGGTNNGQFSITGLRDMGGNACGDGACP